MTPEDVQKFTSFITAWWNIINILFPYVVFLCFGLAIFIALTREVFAWVRGRVIR